MSEPVLCGRCADHLPGDEWEFCWYCAGRLCKTCWESVGHCGHPEAEKANEESRAMQGRMR